MDDLDYWRLCDEMSVIQAALLIVGHDPANEQLNFDNVETFSQKFRPVGYEATKTAIANALRRGAIKGRLVPLYGTDGDANWKVEDSINLTESTIEVESLKQWLAARGVKTGFFFPLATDAPDYLDRNNPRYAPKLAAAVTAWIAIGGESATGGRSPKYFLIKWLREHAAEFGLCDEEGKSNETGIEEIAKVANWQPSGGAPKTPGG